MSIRNKIEEAKPIIITVLVIGALLFFPVRSVVKRTIELRKATKYEKEERYEEAIKIYKKVYKNNSDKRNEIIDELEEKIWERDQRRSLEVYNRMLELYIEKKYKEVIKVYEGIHFELDSSVSAKANQLYEDCLNTIYGD